MNPTSETPHAPDWLDLFDESSALLSMSQILLLNALLDKTAFGADALQSWRESVALDNLDNASFRLMPALYARYGQSNLLGDDHGRIRGIYRYFFYRNNKFMTFAERMFRALALEGIEFLVFKGFSIATQYHNSVALRPFSDCDILVREEQRASAERIIEANGMKYLYDGWRRAASRHSLDFQDEHGNGLDLHWRALLESCSPDIDSSLWARSRTVNWRGLTLRVPAPEDEVLIAAVNGVRHPELIRCDWIIDTSHVIGSHPDLDWSVVQLEMRLRGVQTAFMRAAPILRRFLSDFPIERFERDFRDDAGAAARVRLAENQFVSHDPRLEGVLSGLLSSAAAGNDVLGPDVQHQTRDCGPSAQASRVRFDLHEDATVSDVYMLVSQLDVLSSILGCDAAGLLHRVNSVSRRGQQLHIRLPQGFLDLPEPARLSEYAARIEVAHDGLHFDVPYETCVFLRVRLHNTSRTPWVAYPGSPVQFGLSYHLVSEDGDMIEWDFPRAYFLAPVTREIQLVMPGACIELDLPVFRPNGRGRYFAILDIVHEQLAWFDPDCRTCPSVEINVA